MNMRKRNQSAEDTSQVKCEGLKPQHPQVGDTSTILESLQTLAPYMGRSQWHTLWKLCQQGEEQPHFRQMVQDWAAKIAAMPKTYETNGQGLKAVAHLHYFTRAFDFYITEKDRSGGTKQAFGLAIAPERELGYINIREIVEAGAELDLYWVSKTLAEIRR